jgi:hypothetical protein
VTRARATLAAVAQTLVLAACGSGPTSPNAGITLVLPDGITGRIVTCATCTDPTVWAVVEQDVSIVNQSTRDRDVATVEARAFNHTRGTLISTNTRPNVDDSYSDTRVPAGGTLTLQAGLVYHPLPPPRDEVHLIVVVTFRDGTSVRGQTPLFTGA